MATPDVLSLVLAGGEGSRLAPLTADRAKPAVPFAGSYRLIDFVLSNLVNAGLVQIAVLTQYKSHSLDRHIAQTWRTSPLTGQYVASVPAQMRRGQRWFLGSADAIYQNVNLIGDSRPDYVLVFGADHIYRMDPRQMLDAHIASGAGVTVAGLRVPVEQCGQFGVIETNGERITAFREKPSSVEGLADDPAMTLASMGNYIFSTRALLDAVERDARREDSDRDVGGDLIPDMVDRGEAGVYDFTRNEVPGDTERERGYWRDVGTLDAYYDAHMDLISIMPVFNLYNLRWPILTWRPPLPPAKFVHDDDERRGVATSSLVCEGVLVSGGAVRSSVLGPGTIVRSYADVEGSVLSSGTDVGRGARVRRAIVDKNVRIHPGATLGIDLERDRDRFTVSDGGVVVVGKGREVTA